jgi:hypothetical protein
MSYLKSSLLILLLPIWLWAQQATSSSFHWHLDNMTPEQGTYLAPDFSGTAKLWATTKCEGDSALWDSTVNQYARVVQSDGSTEPVIGDETGSIEFAFYVNKYITNGCFFTFYYSASNYILLALTGSATDIELFATHRGNASSVTLTSTGNDCQDSTWYWVRAQWQQGADTTMYLAVYNNDAGEVGTLRTLVNKTTAINSFTAIARYLYFGSTNLSAANSSNFIDRITCYKGWYWWNPYKAATGDSHTFKKFNRFKKVKTF